VQASAADWALVLLAVLRRRLAGHSLAAGRGHLVFFQHDEVIVHSPADQAASVARQIAAAADEAARLVFGPTQVRFPVNIAAVDCYADAKRAVPAPVTSDDRSRPNKTGPVDAPIDAI
jgi:DNA polymerase I